MDTEFARRGAHGQRLVKRPGREPTLEAMERPAPGPGEVLLSVVVVGLCRTDLLAAQGSLPCADDICLGHEFSGVVEACGADVDLRLGTLVAVDPTFRLPCGRDGFMGVDAPGAIATWVVVPAAKTYDATGLDPFQAAYLEPIAAAMGALPEGATPDELGCIIGDNRIAELTSRIISNPIGGAGATHAILDETVLADQESDRYDWIVETRLSDETLRHAIRMLKPGGRLVLKSRYLDSVAIPLREVVLKRISLLGRTRAEFPDAMAWLLANATFVAGLVGDTYPLDRWDEALRHAGTGEGAKTFIRITEAA